MSAITFNLYLQMFLVSLPVLIVCLGACVVILAKWPRGAAWPVWALLGFGLTLLVTIAAPITQAWVQSWVFAGGNAARAGWTFTVLGAFWSILHACSYALLFIAVLEGRK